VVKPGYIDALAAVQAVSPNQAGLDVPTVQITSPTPAVINNVASDFGNGAVITFIGLATDPVDGTIPPGKVCWSSNVDGPLGTGNTIQVKLSGGPCGETLHTVTLSATNNAGRTGTQQILVSVGNIC
jgi:hypothetical protein